MASSNTSGLTASRYASSLVDIAEDSKKIEKVASDINDLAGMLDSSEDFQAFIKSPLLSRDEKVKAVAEIGKQAKFQDVTINFLSLLAENRRLQMLPDMIKAVRNEIFTRNGEVVADVRSAFPMDEKTQKELSKTLATAVGQDVAMNVSIDETLIGGMVVTVGSKMFDASVKRKLERLKIAMMSGGANTNSAADKAANK